MAQHQIQIPAPRTKAVVIHDLEQCRTNRDLAARRLNLDDFQELVERIDDLLAELHAMMVKTL